jgi:hypothetical protein
MVAFEPEGGGRRRLVPIDVLIRHLDRW